MTIPAEQVVAFLSYSTADNDADGGAITHLARDLEREVLLQGVAGFSIFQDRVIAWGETWRDRINDALVTATFFIPILTPRFFASEECVRETRSFLEYSRRLGRSDLMLPLIYVACDPQRAEGGGYGHPLEEEILRHQCIDWTELRFTDRKDRGRARRLSELALQIKRAVGRFSGNRPHTQPGVPMPAGGSARGESEPFEGVYALAQPEPKDARRLLQRARLKKQQGDYDESKRLHEELRTLPGIAWDERVDLFVDLLYFSVSLHDKLEQWQELDQLERQFLAPVFSKIRSKVSADAFVSMTTTHETSMALAMLRQARLEEARLRVDAALRYPPEPDSPRGPSVLHANALVTRALVHHANYTYGDGRTEHLAAARKDLTTAQAIYRKHAEMGEAKELHHLGRFYGTRAFVTVAECRERGGHLAGVARSVLEDAERAHGGENRTGYGRIAGLYCHAYCLLQIARQGEEANAMELLQQARQLIRDAMDAFGSEVVLGRYKVAGLSEIVLRAIDGEEVSAELIALQGDRAQALERLRMKGFGQLEQIAQPAWLHTPLN